MSEAGSPVGSGATSADTAGLKAAVADLRARGAGQMDAARLRYLEVLSERLEGQKPAVRKVLEGKLAAGLAALQAQRLGGAVSDAAPVTGTDTGVRVLSRTAEARPPEPASGATLLAGLTRDLERAARRGEDEMESAPTGTAPQDLRSVRGFSEVWSKIAAEDQLEQAIERGPTNAGPLNSHMLVLRSLALMRELSPDYLRRFLAHVDALLWLEQAGSRPKAAPPKTKTQPARSGRQKS